VITSPTIGAIAKALAAAQQVIGVAQKGATNPHFRSKYADLQAVDEACRPALSKAGIAIVQACDYFETQVAVTTRLVHGESGEYFESTIHVPVTKQDAQGVGSALTYGRRFGLSALAAVPAGIDDDGNSAVGRGSLPNEAPPATVEFPPATVVHLEPVAPDGELPTEPPQAYPLAFSAAQLHPVWKIQELGTDGLRGGRSRVYYADAVGVVVKLTDSTGLKSPTRCVLWPNGATHFSSFARWTSPLGVGATVRLKGITKNVKGTATYWNYESVEAYKPDADVGDAIEFRSFDMG
jgi:hypothetical protein